ncbi:hypothetical protein FWB26_08895 [Campylobacter jejuni]|uniref:Uncharacterized protein n=2 Tax=Campylobacter TaxID=194 RepID=A0A5Y9F3G6_CAMJU|nr:hypothetical protein [Campylobacter jejuni]EAK4148158.1 hypothetical protein [Campylobacter coli]EAH5240831.1 hypothetical protein [Campylobacter jejuni]EAH5242577.1 hypothetical protein [Campylobacter jejuni]EAH7047590.1 hypothetical protein [Campylobacter jejuni]
MKKFLIPFKPLLSLLLVYFAIVFCTSLPLALTANLINEFFLFGEFVLSNTKQKEPMIRELFHNFIGSAS